MILFGLAVAYMTLLCGGFGIVLLLRDNNACLNLFECCCLAWLFGVGVISLLVWVGGLFLAGFYLQVLIVAVCVGLAFAGCRRARRRKLMLYVPRPRTALEWALLGLLVVEGVLMFSIAFQHGLGWDGLFVWEIKARYAFLGDNVLSPQYYQGGRIFSHPEYPLAIPFTELWLYIWLGEAHQFWAKTIFPLFYLAGIGLIGLLTARLTQVTVAGYAAAVLFFFVPQISVAVDGAAAGYVDFPISIVYLTAIGYLLCSVKEDFNYRFRVYALSLALLPWFKREGLVLWFIALLAGAAVIFGQRKARTNLFLLLPGALVIVGWQIYLHAMNCPAPVHEFSPITLTTLGHNIGRVPGISHRALQEFMDWKKWSIFWVLAGTATGCLLWRIRTIEWATLLGASLLPIAIYLFIYIFSAWPNYLRHIDTSLSRLLMQVVPLLTVAIAGAMVRPRQQPGPAAQPD